MRFRARPIHTARWLAVLATTALSACAGGPDLSGLSTGSLGSVTGYTESNAILPVGYRSREIDATHHAVTVTATATTPRARLEKIATARAAEIGRDGKLGAFKIESVQPGVACGRKIEGYKSATATTSDYATLTLTAVYAPTATDASWLASAETFERLAAEIASDAVAAEDSAASAREVAATCKRR